MKSKASRWCLWLVNDVHGDDDWLNGDDIGVWWLNLYVMIDGLRIIMRCSIIWTFKFYVLSMIPECYILYAYDDVYLYFNC